MTALRGVESQLAQKRTELYELERQYVQQHKEGSQSKFELEERLKKEGVEYDEAACSRHMSKHVSIRALKSRFGVAVADNARPHAYMA